MCEFERAHEKTQEEKSNTSLESGIRERIEKTFT